MAQVAKTEKNTNVAEASTYKFTTLGMFVNVLQTILIATAISIIPLLLNSNTAIFYTSQPLYIMVVFLFVSMILFRFWGLIIGILSLGICAVMVYIPLQVNFVNACANILQLVLLFVFFRAVQKIESRFDRIKLRKESMNQIWHKVYEFFLVVVSLGYILYFFISPSVHNIVIYICALIFMVCTIAMSLIRKDAHYVIYTILIALLPSLLASTCSAIFSGVPKDLMFSYVATWTASNYVLLQSIGYIVFTHYDSWKVEFCGNKDIRVVDLSSLLYYAAALLWNVFILYLFRHDVFACQPYMYFFPWALGNFLLLSNLFFSTYDDAKGARDRFKWYEGRVVVVEKNTSVIITIISFLLPLSGVLTKVNVPDILTFIFIANIFCACFSVGLIWVPKSNIKFIALLKTIKSIFYTYSLILLLMSAIMIMYTYKYQLVNL